MNGAENKSFGPSTGSGRTELEQLSYCKRLKIDPATHSKSGRTKSIFRKENQQEKMY